jgi:hypothetical protein
VRIYEESRIIVYSSNLGVRKKNWWGAALIIKEYNDPA